MKGMKGMMDMRSGSTYKTREVSGDLKGWKHLDTIINVSAYSALG
jgi:hypothetical protein